MTVKVRGGSDISFVVTSCEGEEGGTEVSPCFYVKKQGGGELGGKPWYCVLGAVCSYLLGTQGGAGS